MSTKKSLNDKSILCYGGNKIRISIVNWEKDFGLPPNITKFFKTKINITTVIENSTHWSFNYAFWDWPHRNSSFGSVSYLSNTTAYRKDPFNYSKEHALKNIFPLFIPQPSDFYLEFANLDESYQFSIETGTRLSITIPLGAGFTLFGDAYYDPEGIKVLVLKHLIEREEKDLEREINIEIKDPNLLGTPDIHINEEAFEIETFYGRGNPIIHLTELIKKYIKSNFKKLRIIITNLDAILWYKKLITLKNEFEKRTDLRIYFETLDLEDEKLIPVSSIRSRYLKILEEF